MNKISNNNSNRHSELSKTVGNKATKHSARTTTGLDDDGWTTKIRKSSSGRSESYQERYKTFRKGAYEYRKISGEEGSRCLKRAFKAIGKSGGDSVDSDERGIKRCAGWIMSGEPEKNSAKGIQAYYEQCWHDWSKGVCDYWVSEDGRRRARGPTLKANGRVKVNLEQRGRDEKEWTTNHHLKIENSSLSKFHAKRNR